MAHKACSGNKFAKNKLQKKYHVIIGKNVKIGYGTIFCHPQNIVIGNNVIIGNNVVIYHNCTIGQNNGLYPQINDNANLYPNCMVLGNVIVDENSIIQARSIVLKDVIPSSIVAGVPSCFKKIRSKRNYEN